jgi:hypothetical protein
VKVEDLEPRRPEPPPGWSTEVFEAVTNALADALVAAMRRDAAREVGRT